MATIAEQITIGNDQVAQIGKIQLEVSRAKELRKKLNGEMEKKISDLSNPIRREYQEKFQEIDTIIDKKEKELTSL